MRHYSRSLERKRSAAAFWPLTALRNRIDAAASAVRVPLERAVATRTARGVALHESVGAPRSRLERVPTAATANLNSP